MSDRETDEDRRQRLARAELSFRKGDVLLKAGELREAEQAFAEAVEGNPEHPEHRALLAYTRFLDPAGNRTEAGAAAEREMLKVLTVKPGYGRAHYFLGEIWKFRNDLPRAETEFRAAVDADPMLAEAHRELSALGGRPTLGLSASSSATAKHRAARNEMPAAARDPQAERPATPVRRQVEAPRLLLGVLAIALVGAAILAMLASQPATNTPGFPHVTPAVRATGGDRGGR